MQPAKPNECGVYEADSREIVAQRGRSAASITLAVCEDGLYRFGVEFHYVTGGMSSPISIHGPGFATREAAGAAACESLLRAWHMPFPSDTESVRSDLAEMRAQIEARLMQPTLF